MDDSNPYPALLGIDWDFDMDVVINSKKWKMTYERRSLRVVVTLDPTEGRSYTEHVCDFVESDSDLDQIYKITTQNED